MSDPHTETAAPLMSITDVAAYLNIKPSTLYHWRANDAGPKAMRVGRHLRWRKEDVDAWLREEKTA